MSQVLRLPAIQICQSTKNPLYVFAIDGKLLARVATVSRIRRDELGGIAGYQRPEVLSHIAEIRRYLESDGAILPNAIVVCFDSTVAFTRRQDHWDGFSGTGEIEIPFDDDAVDNRTKPGFVVDGQQRLAAIREASITSFPVCVVGFISDDATVQTEQFILVNSTKPLPKGLIFELLPHTTAVLPTTLQKKRLPAYLTERLNHDPDSPLSGMVLSPTSPDGVVRENSLIRMIENSLTDGVLYRQHPDPLTFERADACVQILKAFWNAVAAVFGDAWGLPPKRSRLLHGAGVLGLGFLMDAISDRIRDCDQLTSEVFARDLAVVRDTCRWIDGYWDFGPGMQRRWNELQNTPNDVRLLANYLLVQYKNLVWSNPAGRGDAVPSV
jgi:DGQHR domain-containing protein